MSQPNDQAVAQRLFQLAVEHSPDAVVLGDRLGRITYLNPSAQRLFGYALEEAVGQPLTILMPERFQQSHRDGIARYLRTGEAHVIGKTVELVARRRDGREFPVELSLASVQADGAYAFSGILRDVTHRKEAERARVESELRAREIERLRELNRFKTQFINTAAHELLTPLTPMRSVLHLLERHQTKAPDPALEKNLALLRRSLNRLQRLVGDLLDASRLEARKIGVHKRPTDLTRVVRESIELYQEEAVRAGVRLVEDLENELVVEADPERLGQVIVNLLSNALKFTPSGGTIVVRTRAHDDSVTLEVQDTGRGLSPEFVPQLFLPFSRAHLPSDQAQPGTGLGLFIVKELVELHGGKVRGQSAGPGKGSTFTVTLPR